MCGAWALAVFARGWLMSRPTMLATTSKSQGRPPVVGHTPLPARQTRLVYFLENFPGEIWALVVSAGKCRGTWRRLVWSYAAISLDSGSSGARRNSLASTGLLAQFK